MASIQNDVQIDSVSVNYLPVEMRMPLKFGAESVSAVTCIRVAVTVVGIEGRTATGWGETPLSVTWAWPSATLTYQQRYDAMIDFCHILARDWVASDVSGHPMEIGHAFIDDVLHDLLDKFNADRDEHLPHLAALIAVSAFDLATHDAYGVFHDIDIYETYNSAFMSCDLSHYLTSDQEGIDFTGKFPDDFLVEVAPDYQP